MKCTLNQVGRFLENSSFLVRKFIFFLVPREEFKTEENPKYNVYAYSTFPKFLQQMDIYIYSIYQLIIDENAVHTIVATILFSCI